MQYSEFIKWLNAFCNYEQAPRSVYAKGSFDLDYFRQFLLCAGIPYHTIPAILISGSKGKGSVASMLACMLQAHGKHVGLYKSPHIFDLRERIRCNDIWISEHELLSLYFRFRHAFEKFPHLTYFEILTALAFQFFIDKKVDFAVFEVGIGGKKDATNLVSPILSILTFIEKEHTEVLGKTLRDIVSQKIGITRKHIPLLVGFQTPYVMRLIREAIQDLYGEKTPPFFSVPKYHHYSIKTVDEHGTSFSLDETLRAGSFMRAHGASAKLCEQSGFASCEPKRALPNEQQFHIRHCGKAALQNAFIAHAAASKLLQGSLKNSNFCASAGNDSQGSSPREKRELATKMQWLSENFSSLENCFLPGVFDIRHAPGLPTLIFDSLHTPSSARHFRQTLEMVFPHRNYTFFLSFLKDKPYLSIVKELLRDGDAAIFLPNRSPRSISPHFLYNFFIHHKNFQGVSFSCMENFDLAFKKHIISLDTASIACIIGSNYLLQEAYCCFSDYFPFTNTFFSGLIEKAVV